MQNVFVEEENDVFVTQCYFSTVLQFVLTSLGPVGHNIQCSGKVGETGPKNNLKFT